MGEAVGDWVSAGFVGVKVGAAVGTLVGEEVGAGVAGLGAGEITRVMFCHVLYEAMSAERS